jgi:hypothetical protein
MKSNSRRYRRHRNPENAEHKESPFFSPRQQGIQKKEDAFFQPKLAVGQPGDSYEREADAVAAKVVNKQAPIQRKEISSVQAMPEKKEEDKSVQKKDGPEKKEEEKKVQKKSDKKEEEKPIQKKEEPEKKPAADEVQKEEKEKAAVMKKENPGASHRDTEGLSQQLKEQSGKGAQLSPEVRNEMSHAIGADFGGVNIHTGPKAVELSNELGAQAFTHGNDVYFNSGKYDTESSTGKQLLAHELTHVVQQGAAPAFSGSKKSTSAPAVQRETSTPLPKGVAADEESGIASFPVGNFSVEVRPDRKAAEGEDVDANGAKTNGNIEYGVSFKTDAKGNITSVSIAKKLVIETVYAEKVSAQDSSDYGRGALTADKAEGHGTLGFHEGSHGTDMIKYIKSHPFPEIVIKKPVTQEQYDALYAKWEAKFNAYQEAMINDSKKHTDEVKDPPAKKSRKKK